MKTERANLALPVQIALAEMGAGRVIEEVLEEHGNQRFKELTLTGKEKPVFYMRH